MIEQIIKEFKKREHEFDEESQEYVKNISKDAKKLQFFTNLSKSDIIQEWLSEFESTIEQINNKLLTDENLTDQERKVMFIKRELNQQVIDKFATAEKILEGLEAELREHL